MKNNKLTILFLLLFATVGANSQSDYYDYSNKKENIFYDGFYNNDNYWSEGASNGSSEGTINEGYYYWQSTISKAKTTSKKIFLDTGKDFEIESRFKRLSGTKTTTLQSLIFGSDITKKYYFGFTAGGSYRISWYDGSSYHAIKDWTKSSHISKYGFNRMTVRKVGGTLYFFINRKKVYSTHSRSFFGNRIGFQASSKTKLKIDYLRVSYLKKPDKSYSSYTSTNKDYILKEAFNDNYRGWSTGTQGESIGVVSNGGYTWSSKNSSARTTSLEFYIDQNRDFEIEADIKFVTG
ncbi:MAG: hypothetical protein JKY02_03210, partial [Flavobacteriaceae bacterium]|nr:hypothetical protein [Flavobacteriaceae bacterium]